jgi:hypothetical protein
MNISKKNRLEELNMEFEAIKEKHFNEINDIRETSKKEIKKLKEAYDQVFLTVSKFNKILCT